MSSSASTGSKRPRKSTIRLPSTSAVRLAITPPMRNIGVVIRATFCSAGVAASSSGGAGSWTSPGRSGHHEASSRMGSTGQAPNERSPASVITSAGRMLARAAPS